MGHRAFIWGGAAMTASKSLPEVFHYPKIYGDGKSYDPRTDRWFEITDRGAPSPRYAASAIWTGKEVIVWGGAWTKAENSNETQKVYADGAIYDPEQGTWRPLSGKGAPSARYLHAAVWTGQEMIIWGGASVTVTDTGEQDEFLMLTDGAIYNPQMDTWRPMPAPPHRKGRIDFSAVWSGSELIIYGGLRDSQDMTVDPITDERHYCHGDGFAFQPKTNQWRNLSAGGSPGPLCAHAGVWTGESMLIWGGYRKHARAKERSGYNYDPATDRWNQLGLQNSPEGDYVFASPSYDGKVHFWGGSWQKFAFANIDGVESRVLAPGAGYVLNP
jgi:N-acetylneuraminic acid mutarotase